MKNEQIEFVLSELKTLTIEGSGTKFAQSIKNILSTYPGILEIEDPKFGTVLHWAAKNNNLGLIEFLSQNYSYLFDKKTENNETVLHLAAEYSNLEVIKFLHENYRYLFDEITHNKETALHLAVKNKDSEVFVFIYNQDIFKYNTTDTTADKYKFLVSQVTNNGETVLHYATKHNNLELIKFICEKHQHLNDSIDTNDETIAHYAVKNNNLEIVKYILEKFPDLSESDNNNNENILHLAAKYSNVEILKYILNKFPDLVDLKDSYNKTFVHHAAKNDNLAGLGYIFLNKPELFTVDILADNNSLFTETENYSPVFLHIAARLGKTEIVKYIIENHESLINITTKKGSTALHMAAEYNNLEIFKLIYIEAPKLLTIADNDGITVMHLVAANGNLEFFQYIHQKEPKLITMADNNNHLPFFTAILNKNEDILNNIININQKLENINLFSALIFAANSDNLAIFKYIVLIDNSLYTMLTEDKQTIFHLAAIHNSSKILKFAIDHISGNKNLFDSLTIKDKDGNNFLHYLAKTNNLELLQYALTVEATDSSDKSKLQKIQRNVINSINDNEQTILHFAMLHDNLEMIKFILEKSPDLINYLDKDLNTPLHIAAANASLDVVKFIDEKQQNLIEKRNANNDTILHSAVQGMTLEIVEYIYNKYPQAIDFKNKKLETVFYFPFKHNNLEIANFLLQKQPYLCNIQREDYLLSYSVREEENSLKELIQLAAFLGMAEVSEIIKKIITVSEKEDEFLSPQKIKETLIELEKAVVEKITGVAEEKEARNALEEANKEVDLAKVVAAETLDEVDLAKVVAAEEDVDVTCAAEALAAAEEEAKNAAAMLSDKKALARSAEAAVEVAKEKIADALAREAKAKEALAKLFIADFVEKKEELATSELLSTAINENNALNKAIDIKLKELEEAFAERIEANLEKEMIEEALVAAEKKGSEADKESLTNSLEGAKKKLSAKILEVTNLSSEIEIFYEQSIKKTKLENSKLKTLAKEEALLIPLHELQKQTSIEAKERKTIVKHAENELKEAKEIKNKATTIEAQESVKQLQESKEALVTEAHAKAAGAIERANEVKELIQTVQEITAKAKKIAYQAIAKKINEHSISKFEKISAEEKRAIFTATFIFHAKLDQFKSRKYANITTFEEYIDTFKDMYKNDIAYTTFFTYENISNKEKKSLENLGGELQKIAPILTTSYIPNISLKIFVNNTFAHMAAYSNDIEMFKNISNALNVNPLFVNKTGHSLLQIALRHHDLIIFNLCIDKMTIKNIDSMLKSNKNLSNDLLFSNHIALYSIIDKVLESNDTTVLKTLLENSSSITLDHLIKNKENFAKKVLESNNTDILITFLRNTTPRIIEYILVKNEGFCGHIASLKNNALNEIFVKQLSTERWNDIVKKNLSTLVASNNTIMLDVLLKDAEVIYHLDHFTTGDKQFTKSTLEKYNDYSMIEKAFIFSLAMNDLESTKMIMRQLNQNSYKKLLEDKIHLNLLNLLFKEVNYPIILEILKKITFDIESTHNDKFLYQLYKNKLPRTKRGVLSDTIDNKTIYLYYAIRLNNDDIIEFILNRRNGEIEEDKEKVNIHLVLINAFLTAIKLCDKKMIKVILSDKYKDAQPTLMDYRDLEDKSLLYHAVTECKDYIHNKFINVWRNDNHTGYAEILELIFTLLHDKRYINAPCMSLDGIRGSTLLHIANYQEPEVIKVLLKNMSDDAIIAFDDKYSNILHKVIREKTHYEKLKYPKGQELLDNTNKVLSMVLKRVQQALINLGSQATTNPFERKDMDDKTPLDLASKESTPKISLIFHHIQCQIIKSSKKSRTITNSSGNAAARLTLQRSEESSTGKNR
jgi:ankyrin repeat protein